MVLVLHLWSWLRGCGFGLVARGAGSDGATEAHATPTVAEAGNAPQLWSDTLGCCSYTFFQLLLVHKAVKYCKRVNARNEDISSAYLSSSTPLSSRSGRLRRLTPYPPTYFCSSAPDFWCRLQTFWKVLNVYINKKALKNKQNRDNIAMKSPIKIGFLYNHTAVGRPIYNGRPTTNNFVGYSHSVLSLHWSSPRNDINKT